MDSHSNVTGTTSSAKDSANWADHVEAVVPHGGVRRLKFVPSLR